MFANRSRPEPSLPPRLFVHAQLTAWLRKGVATDRVRRKVLSVLEQILTHGPEQLPSFKIVSAGPNRFWRRTPIGARGNQFYLWWLPDSAAARIERGASLPAGSIFVRGVRHHDDTGRPVAPDLLDLKWWREVQTSADLLKPLQSERRTVPMLDALSREPEPPTEQMTTTEPMVPTTQVAAGPTASILIEQTPSTTTSPPATPQTTLPEKTANEPPPIQISDLAFAEVKKLLLETIDSDSSRLWSAKDIIAILWADPQSRRAVNRVRVALHHYVHNDKQLEVASGKGTKSDPLFYRRRRPKATSQARQNEKQVRRSASTTPETPETITQKILALVKGDSDPYREWTSRDVCAHYGLKTSTPSVGPAWVRAITRLIENGTFRVRGGTPGSMSDPRRFSLKVPTLRVEPPVALAEPPVALAATEALRDDRYRFIVRTALRNYASTMMTLIGSTADAATIEVLKQLHGEAVEAETFFGGDFAR